MDTRAFSRLTTHTTWSFEYSVLLCTFHDVNILFKNSLLIENRKK